MLDGRWWAIALSEALIPGSTLAVVCEGEELALFRDLAGVVFALEDRCPHRRVPLSLGPVVPGGLQCPYHGWTFEGVNGRCVGIPNLRSDERVPQRYTARCFAVRELNGFIHVWRGMGTPGGRVPAYDYQCGGPEYKGEAVIPISLDACRDVMLDGPQCLFEFSGVEITDFFYGDPRREGDHLRLDRGAVWRGKGQKPAFVRDFPLVLRTRVPLVGGDVWIELLDGDEQPLMSIMLAASENLRGTTRFCWRGFVHSRAERGASFEWWLRRLTRRSPFAPVARIEGAELAALAVAPSRERQAWAAGRQDATRMMEGAQ